MKTTLAISIMVILATGVLVPAFHDAYALKADTSIKLPLKVFGEKTKGKFQQSDNSIHKTGVESIKKEDAKTIKKIFAEYKAKQLLKKLYGI